MKYLVLVAIPLLSLACATTGVSTPHVYKTPADEAIFVSGADPNYRYTKGNQGRDYCRDLENTSRLNALGHTKTGWAFGVLSGLSFGTGVILSAGAFNDSTIYKVSNTAMPILGALFGIASNAAFSRAQDSGELAAVASRSVNLQDDQANIQCNLALSAWNSSRSSANEALVSYLNTKAGFNKRQEGDTTSNDGTPGSTTPGSTTPGSTTPGSTTPGSTTPGSTTPGSTTPGGQTSGGQTPSRTSGK